MKRANRRRGRQAFLFLGLATTFALTATARGQESPCSWVVDQDAVQALVSAVHEMPNNSACSLESIHTTGSFTRIAYRREGETLAPVMVSPAACAPGAETTGARLAIQWPDGFQQMCEPLHEDLAALIDGLDVEVVLTLPPPTEDADPNPEISGPIGIVRSRILDSLGLRAGMTLAEIGMGTGYFVTGAAVAVGPTGRVYGTDIDPEALAVFQANWPEQIPALGAVVLRLCEGERDTGLDDVPDATVDVITMVDSLCFDGSVEADENVAYLSRLRRLLVPGGRFVHHMDCRCDVSPEALVDLFVRAWFSAPQEHIVLPEISAEDAASIDCTTETRLQRLHFIPVFTSP